MSVHTESTSASWRLAQKVFLLLVCACHLQAVEAKDKSTVQWAGVSFVGDYSKLSKLMPTLYDLVARDIKFQKQLSDRVEQAVSDAALAHASLRILVSDQARQGDDSFALTFALAGESVTSYRQGSTTHIDYVIQALVLVANVSKDPGRQRIVTSYPVQVKFWRAYPDGVLPPSSDRKDIVAAMLMGQAGKADLVKEWQKRLAEVKLRDKQIWLSVAPLVISSEAQQAGGFTSEQAAALAFKVSSVVEGNISRSADIPLVPSTFDEALNQITLSFADRGIIAFTKPNPDQILQINVYALRSREEKRALSKESEFAIAYGGGFEIEYFSVDPDRRRKKEFGIRLQSIQSVGFLATSREVHQANDADMYSRLISHFSDELSANLIPANLNWIEMRKAGSELRGTRELVELISSKLPKPDIIRSAN